MDEKIENYVLDVQLNFWSLHLINYSIFKFKFLSRRISVLKCHSSDLKRGIIVKSAANITSKNSSDSDAVRKAASEKLSLFRISIKS